MAKAKAPKPTYVRDAVLIRIVDADTYVARVDLGGRVYVEWELRLRGINAPEQNTPEGKAATAYVKKLLPEGGAIVVETFKNPEDKYGRWLARVFKDDLCVNDDLLAKKMAVPFMVGGA